jgi:adenine-specific DNA-methyltransferase
VYHIACNEKELRPLLEHLNAVHSPQKCVKGRAWAPPRREKLPKWAAEKLPSNYEKMNQLEKCKALDKIGLIYWSKSKNPRFKRYLPDNPTRFATNLWDDINAISSQSNERIGYPTQKPEVLMERIIQASSDQKDLIADFFCGGGTTPFVAQKLGRRWIACDISKIAISVTRDRILRAIIKSKDKKEVQYTILKVPDISIEHWGTYEVNQLVKMKEETFRNFVIIAYNGRLASTKGLVHGYKNQVPIFVGSPSQDSPVTENDVVNFAKEIVKKYGHHQGTMIAWAFTPAAQNVAQQLAAQHALVIDFVKLKLVTIESQEFREHIIFKHPEYRSLLKFILPPQVRITTKRIGTLKYEFDVSESVSLNPGGKIINVQWDFNYNGERFVSTPGFSFLGMKNNKPILKITYEFDSTGKRKIACKVQDDEGGEKIEIFECEVK